MKINRENERVSIIELNQDDPLEFVFNLNGVGTFKVNQRKARKGINPKTREEIKIPASKTVGFKPTTVLKEEL